MKSTDKQTMITCPQCGAEFLLTEAVLEPLRAELRKNYSTEYEKKLQNMKESTEAEAKKKAEEDNILAIRDYKEQVQEYKDKLNKANQRELDLRKKERALIEKQEQAELELTTRVSEQRKIIKEELEKGYTLKLKQQEDQIDSMKATIDDLKKKAEKTSQQAQGEALEATLQEILTSCFVNDEIAPVPTGMRGADVIQKVNGKSGKCCGVIIWESKNTKNWLDGWLDKLKENQRNANADIAVIATRVLPSEIDRFGLLNGVWVTDWLFASQLASALRMTLIQVNESKVASEGKEQKIELLYNYLTTQQFKQRVETIVDAFTRMRQDLAREKQATQLSWSKREKQIDLVVQGTAGLYGDIQGIAGAVIPEIEAFQTPYQLESGDTDSE